MLSSPLLISPAELSHISCDMTLFAWPSGQSWFAKIHMKPKVLKTTTCHRCNFQLPDCLVCCQLLSLSSISPPSKDKAYGNSFFL